MAGKNLNQIKLRSVEDLTEAHEWLFNAQRTGTIDAKTADALNTTLKGSLYLLARLKLELAKLMIQCKIKKLQMPAGLLPGLQSEDI